MVAKIMDKQVTEYIEKQKSPQKKILQRILKQFHSFFSMRASNPDTIFGSLHALSPILPESSEICTTYYGNN